MAAHTHLPHVAFAVAAAAIAISGCSGQTQRTVEVTRTVKIADGTSTTETLTSTDIDSDPSPTAGSNGSRLLPIGGLDFDSATVMVACAGPPSEVTLSEGRGETAFASVQRRGAPTFGDINGDGIDDAVLVLTCEVNGESAGETITTLLSQPDDKRINLVLPLPQLNVDEHSFIQTIHGDNAVQVVTAVVDSDVLDEYLATGTESDDSTTTDDATTSTETSETIESTGPRVAIPERAIATRELEFDVTAEGANLTSERNIDASAATAFDLSIEGLGPWSIGDKRDAAVGKLLAIDPATIDTETIAPCDAQFDDAVRSGSLTLWFTEGALSGLWIDATIGAPPPAPITIFGVPVESATADVLVQKAGRSTTTTEPDGTKFISFSDGSAAMWAVVDADGVVVGAGLAPQPCAVTG